MRKNDSPHLAFFSNESLRLALVKAGFGVRFINTCGEEYESWWEHAQSVSLTRSQNRRSVTSHVMAWIRHIYPSQKFPFLKRIGFAIYGLIYSDKMTHFLRSEDFDYGGKRTCLRVVVTDN